MSSRARRIRLAVKLVMEKQDVGPDLLAYMSPSEKELRRAVQVVAKKDKRKGKSRAE